jgi:hypothetical protein
MVTIGNLCETCLEIRGIDGNLRIEHGLFHGLFTTKWGFENAIGGFVRIIPCSSKKMTWREYSEGHDWYIELVGGWPTQFASSDYYSQYMEK